MGARACSRWSGIGRPWYRGDRLRGSFAAILRPPILATAAALAAGGVAAGRLPLLAVPGWELGMAGCLVAVLLGAPVGIAAARRELSGAQPSPRRAFLAAAAAL